MTLSEEHTSSPPPLMDKETEEIRQQLQRLANILRGRKGMKSRQAVELGKRVEYFKGEKLASFLLKNHDKFRTGCPEYKEKNDIQRIGQLLIRHGYIHRSERSTEKKRVLKPTENQNFIFEGYYTWMYEGPQTLRNILSVILIVGFFLITCFPIWPQWSKVVIWYISVTFLIFILVFTIIRLLLFFTLWLGGVEFWLFPNLFDDSLSVVDSFKPTYTLHKVAKEELKYRLIGVTMTIAFCIWIYNQPADFDEYLSLTKQFTDDVYSGKLLADISQQQKDNIDKPLNIPDLEDLMKEDPDLDSMEENTEGAKEEKNDGTMSQDESEDEKDQSETESQRKTKDEM